MYIIDRINITVIIELSCNAAKELHRDYTYLAGCRYRLLFEEWSNRNILHHPIGKELSLRRSDPTKSELRPAFLYRLYNCTMASHPLGTRITYRHYFYRCFLYRYCCNHVSNYGNNQKYKNSIFLYSVLKLYILHFNKINIIPFVLYFPTLLISVSHKVKAILFAHNRHYLHVFDKSAYFEGKLAPLLHFY